MNYLGQSTFIVRTRWEKSTMFNPEGVTEMENGENLEATVGNVDSSTGGKW